MRSLFVSTVLCLAPGGAISSVEVGFSIDDIEGGTWRARDIAISLTTPAADVATVDLRVGALELPAGYGELRGLQFSCESLAREPGAWQCEEGELRVRASPVQAQDTTWQGRLTEQGEWQINIPRLALGKGWFALELSNQAQRWNAEVRAHRLAISRLADLFPFVDLPRDWGIKGRISGLSRASGESAAVADAYADLLLDGVNYASPDGRQAAEGLVLKVELKALAKDSVWYFDNSLAWPRGALYSEPIFFDAGQAAVSARATGNWRPDRQRLQIDSWAVDLPKIINLSGTGRMRVPELAVSDLTVALRSDHAGPLYASLLQPFLIGTPADDMEVAGRLGLVLHVDEGGIEQAGLDLAGLRFEDRRGRFSLDEMHGTVAWDRAKSVPVSRLTIDSASVYRIPIGRFDIRALFAGDKVQLVEPIVVPVLGGELALDSFELSGALMAGAKPRWEASASVRGVSLDELTAALGWTPFGGTVAGQLRDMRYADRLFTVGGGLELKAFEGDIKVSNLRIQEPLGTVPVLEADAAFRGVSLESLTRTFSFGLIEGGLDGDIGDIRLIGWQPDRFDLHVYTPADDRSRHRISQRAVENLTELGSGVPAGLSATILRIFEEFSYDKIDLKILLQGDVAELDGLARKEGGYYLVRGAGLPRIDVIGRNRSVAWKDLVERLRQIQVEGAQIR